MAAPSSAHASVPAPYTRVGASANQFRCLGRTTRLGPMLLPTQISSGGKSILASPIHLAIEPASALEGLSGEGRVVENPGDQAVWQWQGRSRAFDVAARMVGECDGFCWYEITLTPKRPLSLSGLRLVVPFREEACRYIHATRFTWGEQVSRGLAELGGRWESAFMPYVWTGNEERGLAWCCESEQGFRVSGDSKVLTVESAAGTPSLLVTFLDHGEEIQSPIRLSFGLQATPVKPVSFAWRAKARIWHGAQYSLAQADATGRTALDPLRDAGVRTVVYHSQWADYYGQVSTSRDEALRQLIAECHKRGLKLLVYVGYGLARTAPELQGHHDEWSVMPLMPWTTTDDPEHNNFDATCARNGWSRWLVEGIRQLFSRYDLDGIYFDGTTEAWRCQNTSHGCGWRDREGGLHPTYPILAVREMMRGIADAVRERRPDAILDAHMSASLTMPTLSFCDSYWDGEQYEMYTAADKVEIPLDAFRAEFMGWAHGLDAEFLCYENRPFRFEEAVAMAWLHGVEVRPCTDSQLRTVAALWRAQDRFGILSAKWLPYWRGSGVTALDNSVKASSFVGREGALIFASHLARTPLSTRLRLSRAELRLPPGRLTATDAITGQAVETAGDALAVSFEGMTYRLIEVHSGP